MTRFTNWIRAWVETLRIIPPFSRRKRELLATVREVEHFDPKDWVEVERP